MGVRAWTVVVACGLAGPAGAVDQMIYRWVEPSGRVHYSNVAVPGAEQTTLGLGEEPGGGAPAPEAAAADPGMASDPTASTEASLRRYQAERDLRQTQSQLQDLDKRLADLARLRTRFAKGTEATGGVGTKAKDVRSPEELQLMEQREALVKHVAQLRGQDTKANAQVPTAPGTPSPE